jgi:hypothetical protein
LNDAKNVQWILRGALRGTQKYLKEEHTEELEEKLKMNI